LSKRQSPTTVLFRTTLTLTITQDETLILLGSKHLLHSFELSLASLRGEVEEILLAEKLHLFLGWGGILVLEINGGVPR